MPAAVPTLEEIEALFRRVVREELAKSGPESMSTDEAATYARRSTKTIRQWVADGLPASHRGRSLRIKRADLERWLAGEADPLIASLRKGA